MDNFNIEQDFFEKYKKITKEMKTINIMLLGKTGVGKSTLINNLFRENLAETGERVIIVTGCINALRSRVSGTLVNMIHALLRVIKYNYCKQCMRSKDVLALQY